MSQYRNYVFTLNNYTTVQVEIIKTLKVKYLIFGYEVGSNGTPHLQGYVELMKRKTLKSIKKFMGCNPHIEKRKGTAKQAIDYCMKEKTTFRRVYPLNKVKELT